MADWTCPRCEKTYPIPSFIMQNGGKLCLQCPNGECLYTDPKITPQNFNEVVAVTAGGGPGFAGKQRLEEPVPPPAPAHPVLAQIPRGQDLAAPPLRGVVAAPPPMLVPGDIRGQIQQRALYLAVEEARIEGEIARLKAEQAGYKAEGQSLRRMLKAGNALPPELSRTSTTAGDGTNPPAGGEDPPAQGSLLVEH